MAELPVLRDEQRRQTPRSQALPRASEESFGGQLGRGMRGLQRGLDDVAQAAENIDQRLDAADARERDNLFSERERQLLYAPPDQDQSGQSIPGTGGYLNLQGRNALERRTQVEEELRTYARELSEGSRSGRARAAFGELNQRRLETTLDAVERHNAAQMVVYEDTVSEAAMREAQDNAVLMRSDPDQVNAYINTIEQHAAQVAARRGLGGEAAARFAEERTSEARADVIIAMADDDPSLANDVFERWRGRMTAGDQGRVNEATRAVRLADRARRRWDEIWQETGGDFRRAYSLIETEQNTTLQAELYQHAERTRAVQENAETGDAENAAERARTAISRGGVGSVRGADRALLIREGRWESLVNEFSGRGGGGRYSSGTSQFLLRLSADNPQAFNVIMRVMRNQPLPQGMREEELDTMLLQATGRGVEDWRGAGQAIPAEDYVGFVQMHDYGQGNRAAGDEGMNLIQRSYADVWAVAQMRAGQLGISLSTREQDSARVGELRGFLMSRTRDFVSQHNRAPTQDEMTTMVTEAFTRERRGRWNSWVDARPANSGRYAFEANDQREVTIRYNQIPAAARQRLLREWQASNPDQAESNEAAVSGVEQAYAEELRRY